MEKNANTNELEAVESPSEGVGEEAAKEKPSKADEILRALEEKHRLEEESGISALPDDEYYDADGEDEENGPDEQPSKKRRKKRRSDGHGRLIFGLILTTVIIVVAVSLAMFIIRVGREFLGIDKPDFSVQVEIPVGATTREIADILVENDVITSKWLFIAASKMYGADARYIAGTHIVNTNMAYETIIAELQKDALEEKEAVDVTFPEGISIADAAKRLEEAGVCSAEDFIDVFETSSFGYDFESLVKTNPLKFYKMEGYLFPDTYRFYLDEDPRIVAKKIYANFATKVTPNYMQRMQDLGLTLEETITLASIVQGEASVTDTEEMKKVASVFLNRLADPENWPRLESDATSKYVNQIIKENIELESEAIYKAYNTYVSEGLPPGAIGNPGLDAINAVLYPAETDYYFFCSNIETGEFYYAKTLSEHEANLREAGLM